MVQQLADEREIASEARRVPQRAAARTRSASQASPRGQPAAKISAAGRVRLSVILLIVVGLILLFGPPLLHQLLQHSPG
jgi:hypothetical protein